FEILNVCFRVSPTRDSDVGASSFNLICDATKFAIAAASSDRMFPFRSVYSAWHVRFARDPSRTDGFAFSSRENDFDPGATFVQLQVYVELTVVRVASDVSVMYKKLAGSGRESWTSPATPLPALTR